MHTQRGRELGLGFEQFLDPEGPGKVEPHMDLYDKELKPILMEMLAREDDEAKKAFDRAVRSLCAQFGAKLRD